MLDVHQIQLIWLISNHLINKRQEIADGRTVESSEATDRNVEAVFREQSQNPASVCLRSPGPAPILYAE